MGCLSRLLPGPPWSLFAHDTQTATFTQGPRPGVSRRCATGSAATSSCGEQDALDYFRNLAVQNPQGGDLRARPPGRRGQRRQRRLRQLRDLSVQPHAPAADHAGHRALERGDEGVHRARQPPMGVGVPAGPRRGSSSTQDRNPSSYYQVYTYNTDVNTNYDDGNAVRAGVHLRPEDQVHDRRLPAVRRRHPVAVESRPTFTLSGGMRPLQARRRPPSPVLSSR